MYRAASDALHPIQDNSVHPAPVADGGVFSLAARGAADVTPPGARKGVVVQAIVVVQLRPVSAAAPS